MIPVIIQARLGSTRLPGKVLLPIKGKPMIRMMVERIEMSRLGALPMIACPIDDYEKINDAVAGTNCVVYDFHGPENDVAARFRSVLTRGMCYVLQPKFFVRLCADSPLIDPRLLDEMLTIYMANHAGSFMTNCSPRTFPAGQCIEIMATAPFIRQGDSPAPDGDPWTEYDKEHVFPWWYRRQNFINYTCQDGDFSNKSMVVDTKEDYDRIRELVENLGSEHWNYGWKELMESMDG